MWLAMYNKEIFGSISVLGVVLGLLRCGHRRGEPMCLQGACRRHSLVRLCRMSGAMPPFTAGLSFLNLDWANRSAATLACTNCGLIEWFLADPEEV